MVIMYRNRFIVIMNILINMNFTYHYFNNSCKKLLSN